MWEYVLQFKLIIEDIDMNDRVLIVWVRPLAFFHHGQMLDIWSLN